MAAQATVPASLKSADIARFAVRAQQLQQAKPVIAYWAKYWIAQIILSKGLHSVDEEAMAYTSSLMDQLEQFKAEHASDETVTDDIAGKAYVEQFALETFTRADNAIRTNKATKQTAETFQAAATFLELLAIWGTLEPDIQQKIKFAKFHALRIVKALKAGEDPNLSNPKQEPDAAAPPPLDPSDPEVQALTGHQKDRQPSVIDVTDDTDAMQASLAPQSSINESIHPSRAPSAPPGPPGDASQAASGHVSPIPQDAASFYNTNQNGISPISPDRKSSVGGNYFPRMPSPTSAGNQPDIPPTLPSAPDTFAAIGPSLDLPSAPPDTSSGPLLPSAPGEPSLPPAPTTFTQPQPPAPRTPLDSFQPPPAPGQPPIGSIPTNLPQAPPQPPAVTSIQTQTQPAVQPAQQLQMPAQTPLPQPVTSVSVEVDEEAMMKAQKHARWAISALNFEDVPTAIQELQRALQTLGAR